MFRKLLVALILVTVIWVTPAQGQEETDTSGATTIGEVMGYITYFHLKETDPNKLVDAAIKGILTELGDEYSEYFRPGELEQFDQELNMDFVGIGVELEVRDGFPYVVKVMDNSPALWGGVRSGDNIVSVDGRDITGRPLSEIIRQLKGQQGTNVTITVRRSGQKDFTLELTRAVINLPTVNHRLMEQNIGYIAIESFGKETGEEFGNALVKLKDKGAKAFIIDLRNNGGGYVDAAMEAVSYILGRDVTVFITEGRDKIHDLYKTEFDAIVEREPVVLLINGQSASAAELFAGSLQSYGAAVLVGTTTFGKGTVQDIIPLQNGGFLKITTAYYLTPGEKPIQGVGIKPDIQVLVPELQIRRAKQYIQPTDIELKYFIGEHRLTLNGEESYSAGVIKEGNSIYVPLRYTLEALGYEVQWEGQLESVRVTGNGHNWLIPMRHTGSTLNGTVSQLHHPILNKGSITYMDPKDLKNLGTDVSLQDNVVVISKKAGN